MKSDFNDLSAEQVKQLGALSTKAFARLEKLDLLDLPTEVQSDTKANRAKFWRQRLRAEITGHTELCDVKQWQYRKLKGKLQELAGEVGGAYDTHVREERGAASTTPAGAALLRDMWHLAAKAGLGAAYIKAIIKKWGTSDVNDLTMGQLQGLIATIRRRAASKAAKAAAAHGGDEMPDADNIPF